MNADDTYNCPVCGKPFDTTDGLAPFAISAHEKDHEAHRSSPGKLIKKAEDGTWECRVCNHPLSESEEMARIAMVSHVKQHTDRQFPTSDGSKKRSGGGSSVHDRGLGEVMGDLAEGFVEGLAKAVGKLFD